MQVVEKVMERVRRDGNLKMKAKVPCQQQQQQQLSGHYLCSTVAFFVSLSVSLCLSLSLSHFDQFAVLVFFGSLPCSKIRVYHNRK
jgi:hypothetical protein